MKHSAISKILTIGIAMSAISSCSSVDTEASASDKKMTERTGIAKASIEPEPDSMLYDASPSAKPTARKTALGKETADSKVNPADAKLEATSANGEAEFPDPKTDIAAAGGDQVAVLAGGCFWTQEAVFSHIKGVKSVVSGYAGGRVDTATYEQVGSAKTGHAESVRITYDPKQISYGHLLKIFFTAAHDPTQINRQGPDTGADYRSAIFPQNDQQRKITAAYIAQLNKSGKFNKPIATKIENGQFYAAEKYHQNFVELNPRHPYVLAYDVEKLKNLHIDFPDDWKAKPAA